MEINISILIIILILHKKKPIYFSWSSTIIVPPGPPVNLKVSRVAKDFICLEWRQPKDDGGSKITKYTIKKRQDKKSEWQRVISLDGSSRECKVSDLKEGTEYYLAVCAENKVGPGKDAEIPESIIPQREPSK